jgi:hypothetical protein
LFGDAVHSQWLALCALLFVFDAVTRGRWIVAGIVLGVAALAHPLVAAHGALAVALGGLVDGRRGVVGVATAAVVSFLISVPVTLPVLAELLAHDVLSQGSVQEVITRGFLFRAPHHYLLEASSVAFLGLLSLIGLGALLRLRPALAAPHRRLAGLAAGLVMLFLAAAFFHGAFLDGSWKTVSTLPYVLDLARTSPLLMGLAAVLFAVALERQMLRGDAPVQFQPSERVAWWLSLFAAVIVLVIHLRFDPWVFVLLSLTFATVVALRLGRYHRTLALTWVAAGTLAAAAFSYQTEPSATLEPSEQALYEWIGDQTPSSALFVIPPGMYEFRYYSRRSAYVDFHMFLIGQPDQVAEARRRLDRVTDPDKLALSQNGWPAIAEWDRVYAQRNSPRRVRRLLASIGADFLVLDKKDRERPPYVTPVAAMVPGIAVAFENQRFIVYGLAPPPPPP